MMTTLPFGKYTAPNSSINNISRLFLDLILHFYLCACGSSVRSSYDLAVFVDLKPINGVVSRRLRDYLIRPSLSLSNNKKISV